MRTRRPGTAAPRGPKKPAKKSGLPLRRDVDLRAGLLRATEEILSEQGLDPAYRTAHRHFISVIPPDC